jgi:hypothetical protein
MALNSFQENIQSGVQLSQKQEKSFNNGDKLVSLIKWMTINEIKS